MLEDYPFLILGIGIAIVIGMIIFLKINAFLALITAAMAVSLLGPESAEGINRIKRVAIAFGDSVSGIGIVIALAAIIGKCMMDSGAADRIVRTFLNALGEKNASLALMGSGFVLAVPVFFDTVFYLLIPLARSLYRSTKRNYLMYIMAIAAGGAITHTLVPPTPGPLSMADNLGIDLGKMIFVGVLVALPAAFAGILYAMFANRLMNIPMRDIAEHKDPDPLEEHELPSLAVSLSPIVLPVLMITANTLVNSMIASGTGPQSLLEKISPFTSVIGDANFALLVATAIALVILFRQRKLTLLKLGASVEKCPNEWGRDYSDYRRRGRVWKNADSGSNRPCNPGQIWWCRRRCYRTQFPVSGIRNCRPAENCTGFQYRRHDYHIRHAGNDEREY